MNPMIRLEPVVQRCSVNKVFFKISQNSQENVVACVLTRKLENQTKVQGNTKERHVRKIRLRRAEEVKGLISSFLRHVNIYYFDTWL